MKSARQVVEREAVNYMERADIEALARELTKVAVMTAGTRKQIEDDLQIRSFGKWALLGDSLGQDIKRQLQYSPRIKESMTDWQALPAMDDDTALKFDRMMAAELSETERGVLTCIYQYGRSPEAAARVFSMTNWQVRALRDGALQTLAGCQVRYFR
jgi:hypothetical protein